MANFAIGDRMAYFDPVVLIIHTSQEAPPTAPYSTNSIFNNIMFVASIRLKVACSVLINDSKHPLIPQVALKGFSSSHEDIDGIGNINPIIIALHITGRRWLFHGNRFKETVSLRQQSRRFFVSLGESGQVCSCCS
jgi:hypothetical protein